MDLRTLGENVEAEVYGDNIEAFLNDVCLIFQNCRIYNEPGTTYVRAANRLEKWVLERVRLRRQEIGI